MSPPGGTRSPWGGVALSDGFPAVALLFAELGAEDPAFRRVAHAHLAACLSAPAPPPVPGLYGGPACLAFAAHAAAAGSGAYRSLLDRLDATVAALAARRVAADRERLAAGLPIGSWAGYDVVSGASGFGRLLLARHGHARDPGVLGALEDALGLLAAVATAGDVEVGGVRVPAWWVRAGATGLPGEGAGHLNLGLAHGVGGPLALLSLAWAAGVRVPRHEEAAHRVVLLLETWLRHDAAGPYWPHRLSLAQVAGRAPAPARLRDVWCYGSLGLARALDLAGAAFGRPDWRDRAREVLRAALAAAPGTPVHDAALCHGWSGPLRVAGLMCPGPAADALAARVLDAFEPAAPFAFRYRNPVLDLGADRPGFLEGAAGIALALLAHATGRPPRTPWDAALLLS
ncbi:lanthionine synthetase [Bailinhaonella thermotolerans]|uniref:Lanthionine synthetase n=2 Tax=Bailinhaonella thermotolerans TaxID=1070861 RepID=A0A3A4A9N1_9ACTN|nr:lanthionine synthetase [Bailinhaonella thermotolerans]